LVIRYAYLWQNEHLRGQAEGLKERPCAVILVTQDDAGEQVVTVLPVTHTPPAHPDGAVAIPPLTKRRLGLDEERSWIVLTEVNRFIWPGPDLRPARAGELASVAYGWLPETLFNEVKAKFIALVRARQAHLVSRSE
jgi:hypothetical protein